MKIVKLLLFLTLFYTFFTNKVFASENSIIIATSANLKFAMEDLKKEFKKQTGFELEIVLASSGKLASQIKNGAPFDLFMSADMRFPEILYKEGFSSEKPKPYAEGLLVLWTLKDFDLSKGLKVLENEKVEKLAMALPKTAPYGFESMELIKKLNLFERLKNKIVYGESIAQVNNYISTQVVDLGFTSKSSVMNNNLKVKGTWIELDKKLYKPIKQGFIILKHGEQKHSKEVKTFSKFLFSKSAKEVLKKHGYLVNNN